MKVHIEIYGADIRTHMVKDIHAVRSADDQIQFAVRIPILDRDSCPAAVRKGYREAMAQIDAIVVQVKHIEAGGALSDEVHFILQGGGKQCESQRICRQGNGIHPQFCPVLIPVH